MRKRYAKNISITDGSAAQTAQNPAFLVHGVSVTNIPASFRKDGARKRFSPSLSVPPPTGLKYLPAIRMRARRWR